MTSFVVLIGRGIARGHPATREDREDVGGQVAFSYAPEGA